jgi:hypothetical protein
MESRQGSGHDWGEARKAALFADIVSLKLSIDEAARVHGLRVDVIQEWLRLFRRSALLAFDERLKKTLIDQGANPDTLSAAEFTGQLEDVSIADLVQTLEIAGKDAVITVTHAGEDSRIWCCAGAIVDAESGRLTGESAVYRILAFEQGRMVADLRPEARVRTIYAATHRLLIEALRRKDEATRLEGELGDYDLLYRLGERSTSARVHVSTDELSILRLFDGPRRLGDILAQSHLGDIETLTALHRLVSDGYLVETEAVAASIPVPAAHDDSSEPQSTRAGAAWASASDGGPSSARRSGEATDGGSRPERDVVQRPAHADTPSSPTSFLPMAFTQRPDRVASTPRWVYAAVATALLAPAAFWFGEAMFNWRVARQGHAAAPTLPRMTAEKSAAPTAPPRTFSVSTSVEPPEASIWLDRHPVASGHLSIVLPRDGATHELRVAADGFVPTTLLFADVPPPVQIQLEKLPARAAERATQVVALPSHGAPSAPTQRIKPRAAPAPSGLLLAVPSRGFTSPSAAPADLQTDTRNSGDAPRLGTPQVQIIDGEAQKNDVVQ